MRVLVSWALIYFAVTLGSAFLHQCGHGVGARIDGIHLSTGFASAGDVGKRPSDPDYRATLPVPGRISSTGLLGPFVNWALALLAALWLAARERRRATPGTCELVLGAAALSNAGIRVWPITKFLVTALAGAKLFLDDETTWGLAANTNLHFPMSYADLDALVRSNAQAITHNAAAYFWPAVSLAISIGVLATSYPRAVRLFRPRLGSSREVATFIALPFLLTPLIIATALWLDGHARIDW
jgi:hypothetical protein